MQITLENPSSTIYVRAYQPENHIILNHQKYTNSLIISPNKVLMESELPNNYLDLTEKHLAQLFSFDADIYLLGTGKQNNVPNHKLLSYANQNEKSLDFMDTNAACRTFNVLANEYRCVVALLCLE
ncbi:Mth938-like domain-containing protein [Thiotrichales bacterium 19S11-10]|nr:Mth938-like domain-containing protein [Thiotrichales bacterium 19S11-10]